MSIEISNTVRKSLSRAVFCLLILVPMGAAMAVSKSTSKPNPFLQNPAQPGHVGAYTTQNGVAAPGSLAVPAVPVAQNAVAPSGASATSNNNASTTRGASQKAGGGGL
jgi:hypothetical protein